METSTLAAQDFTSFVFADGENLKTTSLIIAEKFGKQHKNVLRDIDNLVEKISNEFKRLNFELTDFIDKNGDVQRMYKMTKDGLVILVMGYTGSDAMAIKEAYINAFNFMREKLFGKTKYGLSDIIEQIEIPAFPIQAVAPCHPTMMKPEFLNHVEGMAYSAADKSKVTRNKIMMKLAAYFGADTWTMIPIDRYYDVCAYFNEAPRHKIPKGLKKWVMVEESSLELASRVDLTVKLDTLQKTIEQIDWAKERAKNNSVEDAVLNLSNAVEVLTAELAA